MSFSTDMQATANDLLTEFGQTVTITRRASGAYDPAAGSSVITETTELGKGVVSEYNARQVDGTLIRVGDLKLLLSSVGISSPQLGDRILANGKTFTIQSVRETNPAGTVIMYECNVRGA